MADENSTEKDLGEAVADGIENDDANFTSVIKKLLRGKRIGAVTEIVGFLNRLITSETPDTREQIQELSKDEIVITIYRLNLFEKLRHPVLDDNQVEWLYERTVDLWGEAPTEPAGRWAEWNLWVTRHRRRNGISIAEVIEGKKTVEDIREQWIERHQAREERRQHHRFVNHEKFDAPEEVPPSLKHLLFSPCIEDEEVVPEVEKFEEESSTFKKETDREGV